MAQQTHGYYEWQVSTLMLAYDVVQPLPRDDNKRIAERQQQVEEEIHQMAHRVIPQAYRDNPELEFPPVIIMMLTRTTIARAVEIMGPDPAEMSAN